jgi:hypothetical protein
VKIVNALVGKVAAGKKLEVPVRLFRGGRRFGQSATLMSA